MNILECIYWSRGEGGGNTYDYYKEVVYRLIFNFKYENVKAVLFLLMFKSIEY